MISLESKAQKPAEMEFDDLLFGEEEGVISEPRPEQKTVAPHFQRQVSALTAGVQRMSVDADNADFGFVNEEKPFSPPTAGAVTAQRWHSVANEIDGQQDGFATRMGTSAPVTIPTTMCSWHRQAPSLEDLDEENYDGPPRATTFVPPHLMVEKPTIQFSLNSSIADKRAKLRARAEILRLTGFIENAPAPRVQRGWGGGHTNERHNDRAGGISAEVSRTVGIVGGGPKGGRSAKMVGALSKEFGAPRLK
ncbi:hypothetical protein BSKO_00588 [Bryopsis sp. KO-2023]|nr:hypothetical protein BSKO_00588 [Bryopsis sp. KO-2023]